MSLHERQVLFAQLFARLLVEASIRKYEVTLGECWRSPEEAIRLAATGQGITRSLHCDRLAVDINLFRDGLFLTKTEDYAELGHWWEAQHPDCRWGGRFTRQDGNHFAMTFQGRS